MCILEIRVHLWHATNFSKNIRLKKINRNVVILFFYLSFSFHTLFLFLSPSVNCSRLWFLSPSLFSLWLTVICVTVAVGNTRIINEPAKPQLRDPSTITFTNTWDRNAASVMVVSAQGMPSLATTKFMICSKLSFWGGFWSGDFWKTKVNHTSLHSQQTLFFGRFHCSHDGSIPSFWDWIWQFSTSKRVFSRWSQLDSQRMSVYCSALKCLNTAPCPIHVRFLINFMVQIFCSVECSMFTASGSLNPHALSCFSALKRSWTGRSGENDKHSYADIVYVAPPNLSSSSARTQLFGYQPSRLKW